MRAFKIIIISKCSIPVAVEGRLFSISSISSFCTSSFNCLMNYLSHGLACPINASYTSVSYRLTSPNISVATFYSISLQNEKSTSLYFYVFREPADLALDIFSIDDCIKSILGDNRPFMGNFRSLRSS